MSEKTTNKFFPLAGIFFILYGIFDLIILMYYHIALAFIYIQDDILIYLLTEIDFMNLLLSLSIIGLGIVLILTKDPYIPVAVTGGIMFVFYAIRGISNAIYEITNLLNNEEEYESFSSILADTITIPNYFLSAISFAAVTVFVLLAVLAKEKDKSSGILKMWFIPGAVSFICGFTCCTTVLISYSIWQIDTVIIVGVILNMLVYLIDAAAITLYCIALNKENNQSWVCTVCGYIHIGGSAPEACPSCSQPQSSFEIKAD